VNAGRPRALHFFRDREGLEVDFVVPRGGGRLALIEAKASRTVSQADAGPLLQLRRAVARSEVEAFLVHRAAPNDVAGPAVLPNVRAVGVAELVRVLASRTGK
jgi:hypothetical protein